jgi:hypothetical protein
VFVARWQHKCVKYCWKSVNDWESLLPCKLQRIAWNRMKCCYREMGAWTDEKLLQTGTVVNINWCYNAEGVKSEVTCALWQFSASDCNEQAELSGHTHRQTDRQTAWHITLRHPSLPSTLHTQFYSLFSASPICLDQTGREGLRFETRENQ